jgi:hypothetical protein
MPSCKLINDTNYATYDAKYKLPGGSCIVNGQVSNNLNCSDSEYACYANYNLNKKQNELNAKLEKINNPEYESNYQTTMLAGVIWAMIGTTALYYAFTKI